ncbi:MAG: galactofuranosyltransferase [Phocaeicola sp.]
MKKIIVNTFIVDKYKGQNMSGGASYKAPHDILKITLKHGYTEHKVSVSNYKSKVLIHLALIVKLLKIWFIYPSQTYLMIQYPCINPRILYILLPFLRKFYLQAIIHDINSIRVDGHLSSAENEILSRFNELIVHTSNMKDYLQHVLKNKNIVYKVIDCFPYIAEADRTNRCSGKAICFAGNIDKSLFIKDFIKENKDLNLYLYGSLKDKTIEKNSKVIYKGIFNPNLVRGLEGSWGLVWDGNSTMTCSGNWGQYLRIIAPHKFSLYIMAGLPLIVWKNSAMAELVEKKQIGITISSLSQISTVIEQITAEQYDTFCKNITYMQEILAKGSNYSNIL